MEMSVERVEMRRILARRVGVPVQWRCGKIISRKKNRLGWPL
jgi:hypothetical protein